MSRRSPVPPDVVNDVIERDNRECAVCGLTINGTGHVHHRKPRQMGGSANRLDILSNMILLHPSCHLRHVELQRERAYSNGWLLQRWQDPWAAPLVYKLNGWVFLTNDGHIVKVEEEKETK